MVGGCDPAFLTVFLRATDEQRECFDLLKHAYIEARYSSAYTITRAQLEYLGHGVQDLQRLTGGSARRRSNHIYPREESGASRTAFLADLGNSMFNSRVK
jgi:hypothetical protein